MYNYHDSRAHGYEWSRILSRLDGCGMVLEESVWSLCDNLVENVFVDNYNLIEFGS
jgi:hypothetical protein